MTCCESIFQFCTWLVVLGSRSIPPRPRQDGLEFILSYVQWVVARGSFFILRQFQRRPVVGLLPHGLTCPAAIRCMHQPACVSKIILPLLVVRFDSPRSVCCERMIQIVAMPPPPLHLPVKYVLAFVLLLATLKHLLMSASVVI